MTMMSYWLWTIDVRLGDIDNKSSVGFLMDKECYENVTDMTRLDHETIQRKIRERLLFLDFSNGKIWPLQIHIAAGHP